MKAFASSLAAAVLAFGSSACTDAADPLPQGGVHFTTRAPGNAPSGTTCPSSGDTAGIGTEPPSTNPDINPDPGERVIDGQGNAQVSCEVSGTRSFKVEGELIGPNKSPFASSQGEINFSISGDVVEESTGTADIQLFTQDTGPLVSDLNKPCTVRVDKEPLIVDEGKIWATFSCPAMINPGTPQTFCSTTGVVVLENCSR